jgi:subtilisin-like proprotein convertase family protein
LPAYTAVRNNPAGAEFAIGVNAFYGENMAGTWRLHVNDHVNDNVGGTLNSFKIIIYGN